MVGIGLLLVLAATAGPPPVGGAPGARLTVWLPGGVRTVALALFALSALILLALQRPRRPVESEPRAVRVLPRRPWALVLAPLPFLLSVATVWYLVAHYWSGSEDDPVRQALTKIAGLLGRLTTSDKPPTSIAAFDVAIAALVVILAGATFVLVVLVATSGRLEAWWAGRPGPAASPPRLHVHIGALDDLRTEPDARVAIIRAYGRFEHRLAAAHWPRASWQTPAEFMRASVARLPVLAQPVERLTALFEIARFSDRSMGAEARAAACDCLDQITAALAGDTGRAR